MALTDNLIAFWELEEASGTRNDSHGANHLTDNNTVGQEAGKVGNAAYFQAPNTEFLWSADNAALSTGNIDFSICAWVYSYTYNPGGAEMIAAKGTANAIGVNDEWALYYHDGISRFRFLVSDGASNSGVISADALGAASDTTWYFLVAWHDSVANTVNIQVNNGTVNSVSYIAGGNPGGSDDFRIGWDNAYYYWNGRIDQVGFWKRVLTSGERTSLYNSGNGLSYAAMVSGLPPQPKIVSQAVHRAASW